MHRSIRLLPLLLTIATIAGTAGVLSHPSFALARRDQTLTLYVLNADGTERTSFPVASANRAGGASIALGDLGGDGVAEIVVGMGLGNEPRVHVLRADGSEIGSFLAYEPTYGFGVNVAVCDLDGDGVNEIITAPQRGGGPHVRIFSNTGEPLGGGWMAYGSNMTMGVNIVCGDLDGDGRAELVTLPGAGAGPHVNVWKGPVGADSALRLWREIFPGDAASTQGLTGSIADGALTVATVRGDATDVYRLAFEPTARVAEWTRVEAKPKDLHIASITGGQQIMEKMPYGAFASATGDVDGDGVQETVVTPAKPLFEETGTHAGLERSIVVDISEQRLYAYEHGILTHTFLVSTGRPPYRTPRGDFKITAKVPYVHYAGGSGADAYDLGVVPYNLRFYPHIYIHYAPWHNNFGLPMSRGCVNVDLDNIRWIYHWADEGVTVSVRE